MFHRQAAAAGAEEAEEEDGDRSSAFFRKFNSPRGGKSSDQVIQQWRDELDQQRQMFFDRVGSREWDSPSKSPHSMRQGFPFGEGAPRRTVFGTDRSQIPHHFHEDIPSWLQDDGFFRRQRWPSSGSGRSHGSNSSSGSNPETTGKNSPLNTGRSDSPQRDAPRLHKPAARSATGDFPPGGAREPVRVSRASSAPPVAPPAQSTTPRFKSAIHHVPLNNRTETNTGSAGGNVRHIPIMVEGRDEPLLPKVVEEDNQSKADKKKEAIPMPFYPSHPAQQKEVQPQPEERDQNPAEIHDSSIPIPLPYDRLGDVPGGATNSTPPASSGRPSELDQIERVRRETEILLPKIESFQGQRNDRDFNYLDEMLTRLLLKLDNVLVEGREDVRVARKGAISAIQQCIYLLESKIRMGSNKALTTAVPSDVVGDDAAVTMSSPIVKVNSSPAVIQEVVPDVVPAVEDVETQHCENDRHISQLVINLSQDEVKND